MLFGAFWQHLHGEILPIVEILHLVIAGAWNLVQRVFLGTGLVDVRVVIVSAQDLSVLSRGEVFARLRLHDAAISLCGLRKVETGAVSTLRCHLTMSTGLIVAGRGNTLAVLEVSQVAQMSVRHGVAGARLNLGSDGCTRHLVVLTKGSKPRRRPIGSLQVECCLTSRSNVHDILIEAAFHVRTEL